MQSQHPLQFREQSKTTSGGMSQADAKKLSRQFDGNYIMSISKAAPKLKELELMGTSDNTLVSLLLFVVIQGHYTVSMQDSITASLSQFSKLHCLTLSGPFNVFNKPFFAWSTNWTDYTEFEFFIDDVPKKRYGKYAPESFDEAAQDLVNGC